MTWVKKKEMLKYPARDSLCIALPIHVEVLSQQFYHSRKKEGEGEERESEKDCDTILVISLQYSALSAHIYQKIHAFEIVFCKLKCPSLHSLLMQKSFISSWFLGICFITDYEIVSCIGVVNNLSCFH